MKNIMRIFLLIACLFSFQLLKAQDVDVDKSGLVKVDGKDAFYLVKKNKMLGNYDLSVQNLENKELAYLSYKDVDNLPYSQRGQHVGTYMLMTFSETANTAIIFPDAFSGLKFYAKQFARAGLVVDGHIDPKAEKMFVVSHDGTIFTDPNTVKIAIVESRPATAAPKTIDILVKGNKIYNNGVAIGSFKTQSKDGKTILTVYNSGDIKVASATHPDGDTNADWTVVTDTDSKTYSVLYSENETEKLFRFLAEKGVME